MERLGRSGHVPQGRPKRWRCRRPPPAAALPTRTPPPRRPQPRRGRPPENGAETANCIDVPAAQRFLAQNHLPQREQCRHLVRAAGKPSSPLKPPQYRPSEIHSSHAGQKNAPTPHCGRRKTMLGRCSPNCSPLDGAQGKTWTSVPRMLAGAKLDQSCPNVNQMWSRPQGNSSVS